MNLIPINDRIVVRPESSENITRGGIIIPDTAKEKPQRGEIVAVGTGKDGMGLSVKKGDAILFGKYAGHQLPYNGENYLVMREDDILVVFN